MDVLQGEIARNGCNLLQMETKMGPEVQYFCWVLLSSPGVNDSLSTIFFGTPCMYVRNKMFRNVNLTNSKLHQCNHQENRAGIVSFGRLSPNPTLTMTMIWSLSSDDDMNSSHE